MVREVASFRSWPSIASSVVFDAIYKIVRCTLVNHSNSDLRVSKHAVLLASTNDLASIDLNNIKRVIIRNID